MSTPHLPNWDSPGPKYEPTGIQKWWSGLSKSGKETLVILSSIVVVALVIGMLIAIGHSSNSSSSTGLTVGTATASQICATTVGNGIENSDTGQNTGLTVESVIGAGIEGTGAPSSAVPSDGKAQCLVEYSDGSEHQIEVTLFPNGTTGWTADN